ncbi:hypothetical protein CAC42_6365 [Sphaceloma murrayae]|uniref:Uncharacterized protein n=1 Tax=Sphaceloma murrayae TaxID=2082308 RepID=A0A2K1QM81_9PEZI|nr:hypothetical protein CAC42_6365 [Sphaceloma murrayae]
MSSLWTKYRTLPARTRILIGTGLIGYALVAQTLTDKVEEPLGLKATEKDKEELARIMPRIRSVERGEGGVLTGMKGSEKELSDG